MTVLLNMHALFNLFHFLHARNLYQRNLYQQTLCHLGNSVRKIDIISFPIHIIYQLIEIFLK